MKTKDIPKEATGWWEISPCDCFKMGIQLALCGLYSIVRGAKSVTVWHDGDSYFYHKGNHVLTVKSEGTVEYPKDGLSVKK